MPGLSVSRWSPPTALDSQSRRLLPRYPGLGGLAPPPRLRVSLPRFALRLASCAWTRRVVCRQGHLARAGRLLARTSPPPGVWSVPLPPPSVSGSAAALAFRLFLSGGGPGGPGGPGGRLRKRGARSRGDGFPDGPAASCRGPLVSGGVGRRPLLGFATRWRSTPPGARAFRVGLWRRGRAARCPCPRAAVSCRVPPLPRDGLGLRPGQRTDLAAGLASPRGRVLVSRAGLQFRDRL